jgi:predicted ATP-grasp superfamily ATP-dependent carboligase
MKQAIVIGCHVNGLGVIRSLHWKKFRITAMFYNDIDFAQASRYVHEKVKVPHPRKAEKEFVDFLTENSSRWEKALIVDTNDDVSIALSKHREKLLKHFTVVTPDWKILRTLMEKPETYKLAEQCEVPFPISYFPKTTDDLMNIRENISYPCILKPVLGHIFFSDFKCKNFKVNHWDQLIAKWKLCGESGHEVFIQEIIPGPDSNLYQSAMYINRDGKIATNFTLRKLRQNPPGFGVARVALSQEEIPEITEFTKRMLDRIGFKGIMHSEFKMDPRDNRFKLMEVNGRLARANWLATYCGVNFPWLASMDLIDKTNIEISDYQKGVYWIEFTKDVSNSILFHGQESLTIKDFFEPYLAKNKTFADLSRKDFRPFLKRVMNFVR